MASIDIRPLPAPLGRRQMEAAVIVLLDVIVAFVALLLLAPVLIWAAIAVRLGDGGPAFFAHSRVGRDGRSFRCFKLRSMAINADQRLEALLKSDEGARSEWEKEQKLRNDPRVTRIGNFLRKSSIDEIPQLLNVLRGEMSLVGPRPIVWNEAGRYGARLIAYCSVRPGITGLWQVSGRNDVDYHRRVALDVVFAHKVNLGLYMLILVKTVPAVVLRRGAC